MDQQKSKTPLTCDVVIAGGGLAGMVQAVMLELQDLQVCCIDKDQYNHACERTTAISYGSHLILDEAGVWMEIEPFACPIRKIDVLEGSSPRLLSLENEAMPDAPLGWVVENRILMQILRRKLAGKKNIQFLAGESVHDYSLQPNCVTTFTEQYEIKALLVIGADGRQSFTREWMGVGSRKWSYHQNAVVSVVIHQNPHDFTAVEHFKPQGPFAILPMTDDDQGQHRSSIVWTEDDCTERSICDFDEKTFLIALNEVFPRRYGSVINCGKRYKFPLNYIHAFEYIAPRMALIADAAHGIHPIAGQGLNIGLRDISALTHVISEAKNANSEISGMTVLKKYQSMRRQDNILMAAATNFLNSSFSNRLRSVAIGRKIGLKVIDKIAPVRKFITRQAMGVIKNGKSQ